MPGGGTEARNSRGRLVLAPLLLAYEGE
jgi:hypothetical protein